MLEFIMGILFAWWVIPLLLIISYLSIRSESLGWTIFLVLSILVLTYFTYTIPITYLIGFIILYIPIGILWSIKRFNKYCKKLSNNFKNNIRSPTEWEIGKLNRALEPSNNITRIAGWTLGWPLSVLDTFIGDFVDIIETIIKEKLIKIYDNISKKYMVEWVEKDSTKDE